MKILLLIWGLIVTAATAGAAPNRLMALDDGVGHIFGYVIPTEVVALSGTDKPAHIVLKNGAAIDVPINVTYVYNLINNAIPPGPGPAGKKTSFIANGSGQAG